jgi:hypothetical protein
LENKVRIIVLDELRVPLRNLVMKAVLDVKPHLDALRRHAQVLIRSDQEANDLVQGVLLRAYERRATFQEGADLRVWLMSALHDHFKGNRYFHPRTQIIAGLEPSEHSGRDSHVTRRPDKSSAAAIRGWRKGARKTRHSNPLGERT